MTNGGKKKMTEVEYRHLTLDEAAEILAEKEDTLILCHARPDGDALGSSFALKIMLETLGMRAHVACENEVPHRLQFVKCGEDSTLAENIPQDFDGARVVTVDTASPSQLGKLADKYAGRTALMLDHHGVGERYADGFINPRAAAAGEIIFGISEILIKKGLITGLPNGFYERVYAAISSDTGCFKYSSVTPETHRIAAKIIEKGIDCAEVNHKLYDGKPYELLKAEKVGFDCLSFYDGGKIAIIEFPYEIKERYGFADENLETLVDVARCVEGVSVGAVVKQAEKGGVFRASLRSNENVDVAKICSVFGGGGHVKAAGCSIEASSCSAAAKMLLSEIRKAMSAPQSDL